MSCQYYPPADLDELEEAATEATPAQQRDALQIVADIFNHHGLPYGLMGGMNFYFRGSGRATDDVDLAVTGSQSLEATLDLLNDDDRVTRPRNRMSWMGGVARTFVCVGEQQVQIDLKWQRSEGHGMPADLTSDTELIQLVPGHSTGVRFLKIGALIKAKFQSYGRGKPGDYADLLFVCEHPEYRQEMKALVDEIRLEKRTQFLQEVLEKDPGEKENVLDLLQPHSVSTGEEDEDAGFQQQP